MPWTPLKFGKHEGLTIPQVMFKDPDYFFWGIENGFFGKHGPEVQAEADDIYAKARSIRIPQTGGVPLLVEHKFYYSDGTSMGFDLVPATRPPHEGSTPTFRADHIDMSIPRRQMGYDKQGFRIFVRSLKRCLFGDADVRMTKQRCEAFFDDESLFHRNS